MVLDKNDRKDQTFNMSGVFLQEKLLATFLLTGFTIQKQRHLAVTISSTSLWGLKSVS